MDNALITGATKGIGRAIAMAFAAEGLNLAVCSRRYDELLLLQEELLAINPAIRVLVHQTDCGVKDEVLAFAGIAEQELGFISVLVNNVGIYEQSEILDDDEDTFEKLMGTNLMPSYHLYRYFGKTMIAARRGHIFNICSIAGINPVVHAGSYSVTKFAQVGLSKVMRLEMQDHGVKVITVLPGSTFTDSWKGSGLTPDKFVSPGDVASAIICAYKMSPGANVDELVIRPASGEV